MNGVARIGDITNASGAQLEYSGSTGVLVNGREIAVLGVRVQCHRHGNQEICTEVNTGSSRVFVRGKAVVRMGDGTRCGHAVSSASNNVRCA